MAFPSKKKSCCMFIGNKGGLRPSLPLCELEKPSIYHAIVVVFLEFFAWGMMTNLAITMLNRTFPFHTFLMNGIIHGVKGTLTFLSAPFVGSCSDIFGRKFFLVTSVFFTCCPIPLLLINAKCYFAAICLSGIFSLTFSIVYAYVADITDECNRMNAYGLVSATFAASMVISPVVGAYVERIYGERILIIAASTIALTDVLFVILFVPESHHEKLPSFFSFSWDAVDPFVSLINISKDPVYLIFFFVAFFSMLAEVGQYTSFFVYIRLVLGLSPANVAYYIGFVGVLSCLCQTCVLSALSKWVGAKYAIVYSLAFQCLQLVLNGFGTTKCIVWIAGIFVALSSISYPALCAYISKNTCMNQQGSILGVINGIRGLCSGLGPALFGLLFFINNVDFSANISKYGNVSAAADTANPALFALDRNFPGLPFVFGAVLVVIALLITNKLPEHREQSQLKNPPAIFAGESLRKSLLA